MTPKKTPPDKPDPADLEPEDFTLTPKEAKATEAAPLTPQPSFAEVKPSTPAPVVVHKPQPESPKVDDPIKAALGSKFDPKATYVLANERDAARLRSITDPGSGDSKTSPADTTGAQSAYTCVGTLDDGRMIFQATGTVPHRGTADLTAGVPK